MTYFDNTHSLSKGPQGDLFGVHSCSGEQLTPMGVHPVEGVVDAHDRQKRDFLTAKQASKLVEGARGGRYGLRDQALILLAYRHGLRASEATGARREDVDLEQGTLWVRRLKGGLSTEQPLTSDEIEALTVYLASRVDREPWLFLSSQGGRMTRQNFYYLVGQAGGRAELGHVHPHQLRHTCGHVLANKGADTRLVQDWLGHRDIRHTARYTRTAAARFYGLWESGCSR